MLAALLARCAARCAALHSDCHVQKPANEAVQILFTALRLAGVTIPGWGSTHARHPLVRWAACHRSHLRHILALALALFAERLRRYPPTDKDPKIPAAKAGGHLDRIAQAVAEAALPNALPDGDGPPDAAAVLAWDERETRRVRAASSRPRPPPTPLPRPQASPSASGARPRPRPTFK